MNPIKLNTTAKCNICEKRARVSLPKTRPIKQRVMVCATCDMIQPPVVTESTEDAAT